MNFKSLSIALMLSLGLFCSAQSGSGFGFKAGLNYSANGSYFSSIKNNIQKADRSLGYHFGIFYKLGNKIYVKPELQYTATKSDYDDGTFDMKKIDLPIFAGIKVIGPLNVFAGPALQYIVDSNFESIDVSDIKNDFSVGLQFGIGVNLKNLGIDVRYERGFNNNEARFIRDNNLIAVNRLDTRPDQLILGLSYKL